MKYNISIVIESSQEGLVWGRVNYEDNLIVESAADITKSKSKMKKLMYDFHLLSGDEVEFQIEHIRH